MSRLANRRPMKSAERNRKRKTRSLAIHEHNEPGSKLARKYAKAILRKMKSPTRSSKLSFDRALAVMARYDSQFQPR